MTPNPETLCNRYWLDRLNTRLPTRDHTPDIVEYAETTIVPSGTYRGLPFRHYRAPFLKKPLKCLSPDSNIIDTVIMFPAQTGKSTVGELATMYYIQEVPSENLYVSSDEKAAIKWMERRIVPRCEAAGVTFKSEVDNNARNKTGSNRYSKLFPGGNIDIASALSPAQLSQETKRFTNGDEVDRWKVEIGIQGSVDAMVKARTQAWGNRATRLWTSTPTTALESLIYQLFLEGNQEYYWVPCPYCGTMQLMDFEEGRGYGIVYEMKNNRLNPKSIELICENKNCGRGIREEKKPQMLIDGEWKESALAQVDTTASFTINGLYSHMLSWKDMCLSYIEAQMSAQKKRDHENFKMGRPHIDKGSRPKAEKVSENKGNYKRGEVPEGVLYLTMFIDVQQGSEDPRKNNPQRLEGEILGIGYAYKTWSIDYVRFEGDISDPFSGAWEKMHQWALNNNLTYTRSIDGFKFPVAIVLIDSGYKPDVVYQFTQRWENTYPSKGFSDLKKRKNEHEDELTQSNLKRYRPIKVGEDITLYTISTVYYKNQFYNALRVPRMQGGLQKPGFCDFPSDYTQDLFDMYTAEEKIVKGKEIKYVSHGRRNEALDARVGCLCAADIYLDAELQIYRDDARARGATKSQLMDMSHRLVIDEMTRQTAVKRKK